MSDQTYSDGTYSWDVADLWRMAALLKPVEVALCLITDVDKLLDSHCWSAGPMTVNEIMEHADRVERADLSYPIILTPDGCIADGVHRVVKCLRTGQTRILAVYLPVMPPPKDAPLV